MGAVGVMAGSMVEAGAPLLLAVAAVIIAARLVGRVMVRFRQPRVLGEILAGVLLGPSLLGAVSADAFDALLSPGVVDGLRVLAQLGLVLFMFLVGVELDVGQVRGRGAQAVVISTASMAVPFVLGVATAPLIARWAGSELAGAGYVLFMGAAMAITAFPVLARILQETGLHDTPLGALALTCAAANDVTAWCVLAGVVALVQASGIDDVLWTVGLAVLFVAAMFLVVRPVARRVRRVSLPAAVALALVAARVTDSIGIHAIFGAFLAGVVLTRDEEDRRLLIDRLETSITVILLPVFFVVAGLSVEVGRLSGWGPWCAAAAAVVVAVAGKVGGASGAAVVVGLPREEALRLGILLNTRGLTEIVILTVGLELGVLDATVFTIMVLMALVTTLMAAPVLNAVDRGWPAAHDRK